MQTDKRRYHITRLIGRLIILGLACGLVGCGAYTSTTNATSGNTTTAAGTHTTSAIKTTTLGAVTAVPLLAIRMIDQQHGWALSTNNIVVKTNDGGQTWIRETVLNVAPHAQPEAVFADNNRAWVAYVSQQKIQQQGNPISTFTVMRTSDGGANWLVSTFTDDVEGLLDRPHFANNQLGWLEVGMAEGMFHTRADIYQTGDGGQTWTKIASSDDAASGLPEADNKNGISFRDTQTGWATADIPADYSWLYVTHNGGKTWQEQKLAAPAGIGSIGEFITTPPVLFGNNGILPVILAAQNQTGVDFYTTHDGGATWTPGPLSNVNSYDTYILDLQHAWATDNSAFYATSDGGNHWARLSSVPQQISALSFVDTSNGWALGAPSEKTPLLLHTTDGGKTWQAIHYVFQ